MPDAVTLNAEEYEFVRALNEQGVRFLVVGGRAVRFYCPERIADDLDVLVGYDGANLAAAMDAMGRVDPKYFRKKLGADAARPGIQAPVSIGHGHADVLTSIAGVDFERAWGARRSITERGLAVHVLSLADLIANKQAQGDEKARADLALLRRA
jgi:hypothetical protein